MDGCVFLVTGPSAAGKTTVARLLAGRFSRGVHLEGDWFRRSIVSGRIDMTPDAPPEAVEQLQLRYRLAARVADAYWDEVSPSCSKTSSRATTCRTWPGSFGAAHSMSWCSCHASRSSLRATRSASRPGYRHWSLAGLYAIFATQTPRIGLWLDSSEQTPDQTVDSVLERTSATPRK